VETETSGNQEAMMGQVLFETNNAVAGKATQRYPKYVTSNGGAETEDVLTFGAKKAAYESTEQAELEPVSGKRGLFSANTGS
jgi:hypothetical protein